MKQYVEIGEGELRQAVTDYLEKQGLTLNPEHTIEISDGRATILLSSGSGPTLRDKMKEVVLATANTLNIRHARSVDDAEFFKLCNKIMDKMGRTDASRYSVKEVKQ